MGPLRHALISAPIAGGVYLASRSRGAAIAAFAAGTAVDLDHLIDYFTVEGARIDVRSMRTGEYFGRSGRVMVLSHSYELVALLCLGLLAAGKRWTALGTLVSAMTHMIGDVMYYRFRTPACYSLAYRLARRFDIAVFSRRTSEELR